MQNVPKKKHAARRHSRILLLIFAVVLVAAAACLLIFARTPAPAPETPAPSAAPTAEDLPLPDVTDAFPVDVVTTEAPVYTPDGSRMAASSSAAAAMDRR